MRSPCQPQFSQLLTEPHRTGLLTHRVHPPDLLQRTFHNKLVYERVAHSTWRASDRDRLARYLWKKLDEDTFLVVATPTSHHDDYPANMAGVKRDRYPFAVKMSRCPMNPRKTDVDFLVMLNTGSEGRAQRISSFFGGRGKSRQLHRTIDCHNHFEAFRPLEKFDNEDGRSVGLTIMDSNFKKGVKSVHKQVSIANMLHNPPPPPPPPLTHTLLPARPSSSSRATAGSASSP